MEGKKSTAYTMGIRIFRDIVFRKSGYCSNESIKICQWKWQNTYKNTSTASHLDEKS